ncbi:MULTISPECIES: S41 family peptidase [Streptomyces]|uniref:Tricorn protease homolog n=1 Tax=Streptomyces venezuelae TaxID=54571 RepID=A0A5P2BB36_STRVZ|nr:S41 family peptidase [Streptomyces venezuelae]MYY81532.1 peptidase S41 [Streptomyces sp. SID335]MYZ12252.1 peptidase S41 [Streptomyces sp. SID337]NDZ89720.1 peptidase S41 [Streptomyces sp. SID10115]NEB49186.1 peptidase S41 [Streptomyces sp. SID339]QES27725.1 peptidase S41 [Streptomyces venezuelae]
MTDERDDLQDDHAYLRFPHLSGDRLCFAAEDDLWVAPLSPEGSPADRAWRLTVDRTKVSHPRFSPDGRHIAYTTWRSLDPEIHLAPVDGGPARRLTYWGSTDTRVCGWSPDGDILAVSSHGQPFSYFCWAYSVPTDGSPGGKLPWGPVWDIAITDSLADGDSDRKTLLLTGKPPHEPAAWKRYRGGATGRLWVHGEQILADLDGHLDSPMFVAGRIAFLSDHEGVGNLYSCLPDGSDLRRHTDHDTFYARHASSDGTRVVYQCAGDVWLVDGLAADSVPRRLDVRLGGPRAGRRIYQVPAAQHVDALSVDTTGRASAVVVRGSLYWLTHRDGPARTIHDTPGVRVRLPEMLGTGGQVAYVTDADGEDAVEIAYLPRASGARDPRRLASGQLGRVQELVADRDGERLAIASNDGRLLLLDVTEESDGEVTELIRSINGPVRDLAFSPDGCWLTWSHPGIGRSLRQIKLARIAGPGMRAIVDVTNGRFEDENPVFTRDGRYLAFLSWRGFDPVYDVHTGDLSFPLGCRPYLVPLSSATPSPFALLPDGRPAAGGLDPAEGSGGDGTTMVEIEGLESRVTPFPVSASKYSALHPVSGGGLVWLRWPISGALGETFVNPADMSGRPTLEYFNITKAKKSQLVDHLDWFAPSGDGSRLVVVDEGDLSAVPSTEVGDVDTTVWIDLRRILHEVDPAAEWRQAYEEAGRIIRAYFWDPEMSGVDWDGVLAQYRPLVERVASPDEFADLLREVLGELGTSHAYVSPARRNEGPPHYQRAMGLLGANLVRRDDGWMVKRILPGDSSDSKARSPLAGAGIREGAVLTHIDGRPVDPVTGPYPLLSAAGGTTVELTFEPEGEGRARRVAIVPLINERPLRYQDWVAKRRDVVRELSGGKCGYLHIPDMGGSGWAQFNRDLRLEVSRPALIVDVRGNAGGHISELVIEKLTRKILGWDLTRNAQPVSYASNAPRGPVVALADEATSSDGDMITAAFKLLGLGPVVGQRTWGGVVGMTGRHTLGDGTVITVPMNAGWFDAYGWGVENHGVSPDLDILRTPLDWAEGRHAQLDDAVQLALDLLERNPAASPPDHSDVPDRSRPPLPPRP